MNEGMLHHMTSASALRPVRETSLPSSPTSVRSSSSAIFERDIEPIVPPSPPFLASQNPHRIPRAKGTEQLEHSVPSVLDSAAAILTGSTAEDTDAVVVTPAHPSPPFESLLIARSPVSGFTSPIGSFRSRSPSPLGLRLPSGPGPIPRTELLLSIPNNAQTTSTTTPPTVTATTSIPSPNNNACTTATTEQHQKAISPSIPHQLISSPTCSSAAISPHNLPIQQSTVLSSPTSWTSTLSHPPSPTHGPSKRLSFMSYSDLLSSIPTSTLPLASLTTSASYSDPPPHIPSVSSLGVLNPGTTGTRTNNGSATTSLRGFNMNSQPPHPHHHHHHSAIVRRENSPLLDVGGEWEREGLGRGLEERLETLIGNSGNQVQVPAQVPVKI